MTWKPQIDNIAEKATKRCRLLKRLTATKWGATQDVLVATYKTYVRPILEYGSDATITASTNTTSKLEVAQDTALRVITGAPKSTPITSMEAQIGIEPIQCRREQHGLTFWERQRRILPQKWDEYRQAASRLKTQTTPLTKMLEGDKRKVNPDIPLAKVDNREKGPLTIAND
ncbi:uncharacterized protein [Diabrotica undecimpunctata]|uniref:uncharacterized protein n=1 Tax=Diabrotica undecimpunctata TaxID=50387 RepID=UPI003B638CFA